MARIDILDQVFSMKPGPFLTKYFDWIFFTILVILFISLVNVALSRHFANSRARRTLVISVGLLLSIPLYMAIYKGKIHIAIEGIAMYAILLIFIIFFFVLYIVLKAFIRNRDDIAFALSYCIICLITWRMSSDFFKMIADSIPFVNGGIWLVFIISFIYLLYRGISYIMTKSKSPFKAAKSLQSTHFASPDDVEIEKEIRQDKQETKLIKGKTMRLTKVEIKTLEDIERHLNEMIAVIKNRGQNIDQNEIAQLTTTLRQIARNENIMKRGMDLIKRYIMAYKNLHRKDIGQLEKRLTETQDAKKRKTIEEELTYQKKMIEALKFMDAYESKVQDFTRSFNQLLYTAMQKLKTIQPNDAIIYMEKAKDGIHQMRSIYEKQHDIEKYLLTLNKKTIRDLKKEKARI